MTRLCSVAYFSVVFSLLWILASACHSGRGARPPVYFQIDELRDHYLTNSPAEAKQAMLEALKLMDSLENRRYAEEVYWLAYARLFCIEALHGDSELATIYFEKARYWYLVYRENSGASPAKLVELLKAFKPEHVKELMLERDKAAVGKHGPRYYREWEGEQGQSP